MHYRDPRPADVRPTRAAGHTPGKSDKPSHTPGTTRGEEWVRKHGREPGRGSPHAYRTARDATSIEPQSRTPIDPRMPDLPPA